MSSQRIAISCRVTTRTFGALSRIGATLGRKPGTCARLCLRAKLEGDPTGLLRSLIEAPIIRRGPRDGLAEVPSILTFEVSREDGQRLSQLAERSLRTLSDVARILIASRLEEYEFSERAVTTYLKSVSIPRQEMLWEPMLA